MPEPILAPASPPGRFAPMDADYPAVKEGWLCPGCDRPFEVGQRPALANPLPETAHDLLLAADGCPYQATVVLAHEDCAHPEREDHTA